jgi:hypothetical protein
MPSATSNNLPAVTAGRAQADAFAAGCEAFRLSATVGEHADSSRDAALSVVALAPGGGVARRGSSQ